MLELILWRTDSPEPQPTYQLPEQIMKDFQYEFIQYSIDCGILQFGEFILKSGRKSPYFYNTGLFNNGERLFKLGHFYAEAIVNSNIHYDLIYGPAYKGISLVCATSIALYQKQDLKIPFTFNRKEVKDHGEGGTLVGAPISGSVLILDDVITSGNSVRESVEVITLNDGIPKGVVIALDREEKGQNNTSAIDDIKHQFQMRVISIISLSNIIEYFELTDSMSEIRATMEIYRNEYGIR